MLLAHRMAPRVSRDLTKTVTLKGTIKESSATYSTPHVYFLFDVKDAQGNVTEWGAETDPPIALEGRYGWSRGSIWKTGDEVTVTDVAVEGRRAAWVSGETGDGGRQGARPFGAAAAVERLERESLQGERTRGSVTVRNRSLIIGGMLVIALALADLAPAQTAARPRPQPLLLPGVSPAAFDPHDLSGYLVGPSGHGASALRLGRTAPPMTPWARDRITQRC